MLSYYPHSTYCHLLQVKNMPPSVTETFFHSTSTIAVSHNCAWLMAIGSGIGQADIVLLELSEWHNETKTSTQSILMRCSWFKVTRYLRGALQPCTIGLHIHMYLLGRNSQTSQTGPGERKLIYTRQKARAVEDQIFEYYNQQVLLTATYM